MASAAAFAVGAALPLLTSAVAPETSLSLFVAPVSLARLAGLGDELEIIGEGGSLFLDDPWHCREPVIELRRGGRVLQFSERARRGALK